MTETNYKDYKVDIYQELSKRKHSLIVYTVVDGEELGEAQEQDSGEDFSVADILENVKSIQERILRRMKND